MIICDLGVWLSQLQSLKHYDAIIFNYNSCKLHIFVHPAAVLSIIGV